VCTYITPLLTFFVCINIYIHSVCVPYTSNTVDDTLQRGGMIFFYDCKSKTSKVSLFCCCCFVSFSSASGVIQRCTQSNKRRTKEEVRSESYVPATDIGALLLRIYSIGILDNGVLQHKCLDF
jgi:hypothetical protein